ncbi:Uncharacterised protein [Mycobacteroides abscessus]|nr:Uncharacterised protein [Mycobacteroides abscessus]
MPDCGSHCDAPDSKSSAKSTSPLALSVTRTLSYCAAVFHVERKTPPSSVASAGAGPECVLGTTSSPAFAENSCWT